MIFMTVRFESVGRYTDPTKVTWEIVDDKKQLLQRGELSPTSFRSFGPFGNFQKVPNVNDDEVGKKLMINNQCKNVEHMRLIFWKNLMYWKKNTRVFRFQISSKII